MPVTVSVLFVSRPNGTFKDAGVGAKLKTSVFAPGSLPRRFAVSVEFVISSPGPVRV